MKLPKKKRRFGFVCLVVLLIPLLFFGWIASPVIHVQWIRYKLKQPARYEAVLDASIELWVEMKKQKETQLIFDEHYSAKTDDSRVSSILKALRPVKPLAISVRCEEDYYDVHIPCIGAFFSHGYNIYRYKCDVENKDFIVIQMDDDGDSIVLKEIPFKGSRLDARLSD
jgi:hypothetical protein